MIELFFGIALMASQVSAPEATTVATGEMSDAKSDALKAGLGDMAPAAQDDGKMECRIYKELGSRLRAKRICKTRSEWINDREANNTALREQRGGAGGPQLGNGG